MKTITTLSFAVLILLNIGCEDTRDHSKKIGNYEVYDAVPAQGQNENNVVDNSNIDGKYINDNLNNTDDKIKMLTSINPKTGLPMVYIPYPESWEFIKDAAVGQPSIKGPNGLICILYPGQTYMYTNNSMMNESYQNNGIQVMAPVGVESVVNQVILPQCKQMGMTLVNQYSIPEVAAKDREYAVKLNEGSGLQVVNEANGTEWKDAQGNKALVVLHYWEMKSSTGVSWGYNAEMMKVQDANFEKAKRQYVYSMANKLYNQKDVAIFQSNLANQIKTQEDHATAMRNINSKGSKERLANDAATNEYVRNVNKGIAENKAHNNDLLQQQTNNALTDVSVVVSPFDGKEYQVEAGNKTYWINNEGKYIKSDDPLFDPNKYETGVGVWQKAPAKVYQ